MPASSRAPQRGAPDLQTVRGRPDRAGIFLDFDGTLSEIVQRPELASALPDVPTVLTRLARTYAVVAVVSGRPAEQVSNLVAAPGVEVFGLYGLLRAESETGPPAVRAAEEEVRRVAAGVAGARVEDKGPSIAVHYRGTLEPHEAGRALAEALLEVADRHGLRVLPGKMVVELVPPDVPGKGAVVLREADARNLEACLFAGDDRADLDAFAALDELRSRGLATIKLAVRSAETPEMLLSQADLIVEGPSGLMSVLSSM